MPGEIAISLEREPSYFAAAAIGADEHQTIVAEEAGRIVCCGSVTARQRFINGEPTRVGYLGGLRLDANCRGRTSILRRGYELFRRFHENGGPAVYFTSIVSGNKAARRLLEAGLPGMPTYTFLGDLVTLAITRRRTKSLIRRRLRAVGLRLDYGSDDRRDEVAAMLRSHQQAFQFAPVWSSTDFTPGDLSRGPGLDRLRIITTADGKPVACAALWDQRTMKQAVVRGYSPRLRRLRPLLNVCAAVLNRPRLPAIGAELASGFISHVVTDLSKPEQLVWLTQLLFGPARSSGVDYLLLGFDARDPRLPVVRQTLGGREYRSRLYAVHWDAAGELLVRRLDGRLLAPEAALL